ncbi:hypothetical protein ACHAP5_009362 [Fusarium lateritium]
MSDIETFHKFRDLPLEIRRRIWALSLNTSGPRAYYVDVNIPSDTQPQQVSLRHVSPGYLLPSVSDTSNIHCRTTNLEAVSQEAQAEVAHTWKTFNPETPFTLTADSNGSSPSTIHGETNQASGDSAIVVDAENDLFIAEKWRIDGNVISLLKVVVNYYLPLPQGDYSGLETIKQISIPYKDIMFNDDFLRVVTRTLAIFPNIRTLFIHLEPAELFDMNNGPTGLDVFKRSEDNQKLVLRSAPQWYFAAEERQGGKKPFFAHTRDRIYYELCTEKVLDNAKVYQIWGGFRGFIDNRRDVDIKFLSWWNE